MDLTINETQQAMESAIHAQPQTSSIFNATDTTNQSSQFTGFSSLDFSLVPLHVWQVIPKKESLTIVVHKEAAFRLLENSVLREYGEPTNIAHNGRIYRGCDPSGASVTLTFYQTTWNVRVQGTGYAYWANKVLPKFAKVVMEHLQRSDDNSVDIIVRNPYMYHQAPFVGSQSGSSSVSLPSGSGAMYGESLLTSTTASQLPAAKLDCSDSYNGPMSGAHSQSNLQNELIVHVLNAYKLNGKYEAENASLQAKIIELENENKAMQIQFSRERHGLLKHIQDISTKTVQHSNTPDETAGYRTGLLSDKTWSPLAPITTQEEQQQPQLRASVQTSRPQPDTQALSKIPLLTRLSVLSDHHDNDTGNLHSDVTVQSTSSLPPSTLRHLLSLPLRIHQEGKEKRRRHSTLSPLNHTLQLPQEVKTVSEINAK